jgi:hypothetical protein
VTIGIPKALRVKVGKAHIVVITKEAMVWYPLDKYPVRVHVERFWVGNDQFLYDNPNGLIDGLCDATGVAGGHFPEKPEQTALLDTTERGKVKPVVAESPTEQENPV